MNDQPEIAAERRVIRGKKVKTLREKGLVPATLYGHHLAPVSLQVDRGVMEEFLRHGQAAGLFRLKVGRDKPQSVLIKQYQRHPVRKELLHVDFYGVSLREKVKAHIPLRFVGQAPVAESHDVVIVRAVDQVDVECFPADLPTHLDVDLSGLESLDSIVHLRDLSAGPKVTILGPQDEVVVSVTASSKEEIGPPAEEPEGISEEQEESAEKASEELRPAA